MTNIKEVLADRGKKYGHFPDHARITQDIKRAMANSPNWRTLDDTKKEALDMVAHKIGRILNGDPEYDDSWIDIVGYTTLATPPPAAPPPPYVCIHLGIVSNLCSKHHITSDDCKTGGGSCSRYEDSSVKCSHLSKGLCTHPEGHPQITSTCISEETGCDEYK